MATREVLIRRARASDADAIAALMVSVAGWDDAYPNDRLVKWSLFENIPAGPLVWLLAGSQGETFAVTAFRQWSVIHDGRTHTCGRHVLTASADGVDVQPLIQQSDAEMKAAGLEFLFRLDEQKAKRADSAWTRTGRLPVAGRPTRASALPTFALGRHETVRHETAHHETVLWPERSSAGCSAVQVLMDAAIADLIASQPPVVAGVELTPELLEWRYRFEPLNYRAWTDGKHEEGMALFSVRRRGSHRECVVGTLLAPNGEVKRRRELLSSLTKAVDADYVVVAGPPDLRNGFVRLRKHGPHLSLKPLASEVPDAFTPAGAALNDVHLF